MPTIDLRVDYHAAAMPGDLTVRGKIVRMGGQFSTAEAHVYDGAGQAARERPRHLFHRAAEAAEGMMPAMPAFTNLGDLDPRDRDLDKIAIIDLGGEKVPREFTYRRLDAHGERRRACALPRAASRAGTASPSCPPTAPNTSPPISASCAPASSRCR